MANTTTCPSRPELSRRASFGWTLVGRIVYGIAQWGTLVAVAKVGSVTDVGRLSLGLAVTGPVMIFCNMHLRNLYATDLENRFRWETYVRVRRATAIVGALVCCVLGLGLYSGPVVWVIAGVAFAKAIEMLEDLQYGVFQRFGRMDGFSLSLILRGILGLSGLVVLLHETHDLRIAVLGMGAAWAGVWLLHDRPRARALRRRRTLGSCGSESASALVLSALPMGLMLLVDSLNQNLPRFVVEAHLGEELLGFYVPMTYVVTVGSAFVFALGAPLAPRLARHVAERDAASYAKLSMGLLGVAFGFGVTGVMAAVLLGDKFLSLAYAESFAVHQPVFVWIMAGGALHFMLTLSTYSLIAARRLTTQALAYVAAAATTALAAWSWVPCDGLMGAAKASVLGLLVGVGLAIGSVAWTWWDLRHGRAHA